MKFTSFIAIIALGFFSNSCKKKEITYDFQGKVKEWNGGSPISGAEITITQQVFNSTATNINHEIAAVTSTNANGDYTVNFDREKVTEFGFIVKKDWYFTHEIIETSGNYSIEDVNVKDFELEPYGYFKFKIKNISPIPGDQLKLFLYNFKEGCNDCASNGYTYLEGEIDTTLIFQTTAKTYHRFFYTDQLNGTTFNDSLLTIHKDTVTYTINY